MATMAPARMTEAEFLALPNDGIRRWLVDGEVKEYGMTVRNRDHSRVLIRIGQRLENWLDTQPLPCGEILGGEAGFRLPGNPEQVVGIDVAYIDAELAAHRPLDTTLVDGVPVLAVEILSPNDTLKQIRDRSAVLLKAGVKIIWFVEPEDQTVQVRRPGVPAQMFNVQHELTAEPELPGFRVPVASLFGR